MAPVAARPHNRDLATFTAAALWLAATFAAITISVLLPDIAPNNPDRWRAIAAALGFVLALFHIVVIRRLSYVAGYHVLFFFAMFALAVNTATMFLVPIAASALIINALLPLIPAAYYFRLRATMILAAAASIAVLIPEIFSIGDVQHVQTKARLAAWIPLLWLITLVIHWQTRLSADAMRRAEDQALTDPLTGLGNLRLLRNRFDQLREARGDEPRPQAKSIGLLLIDIDDFQDINAMISFAHGDTILRRAATALEHAAAPEHLVVRTDGDEFAVLIDGLTSDDVEAISLRYRRVMAATVLPRQARQTKITASIGWAIATDGGETLDDLITVADRLLNDDRRRHYDQPRGVLLGAIPLQDEAASSSGLDDRAVEEDELPGLLLSEPPEQLTWNDRPYYAVFAAAAWLICTALILIALAMPDADRSKIDLLLLFLLLTSLGAVLNYFFAPQTGGIRHAINDLVSLAAIGGVVYLTGGIEGPAWPFAILFVAYAALFLHAKQLAMRVVAALFVMAAPLLYQSLGSGVHRSELIVLLSTGMLVAIGLAVTMGYNRINLDRARDVTRRMAEKDPLTGLPNRSAFERELSATLDNLPYRASEVLAVLIISLDNFRRFNDGYGHATGDRLMCAIADELQLTMRGDDHIARIGGNEFAIALAGVDGMGAQALAKRIVHAVDRCVARSPLSGAHDVSAYAGFALYGLHGRTINELMSAADLALMSVRSAGNPRERISRLVVRV